MKEGLLPISRTRVSSLRYCLCRWRLTDAEKTKTVFLFCLVFIACSLFISMYLCPDQVCGHRSRSSFNSQYQRLTLKHVVRDGAGRSLASLSSNPFEASRNKLSFEQLLTDESFTFDIRKNDVIVFLHIQKTGKTPFSLTLTSLLQLFLCLQEELLLVVI